MLWGDYVRAIRLFGGTDGFSTQVVSQVHSVYLIESLLLILFSQGELAHKVVKRLYGSTNKRNAEPQIAKGYRRLQRAHLSLDGEQASNPIKQKERDQKNKQKERDRKDKQKKRDQKDNQPDADSDLKYYISPSKNNPQDIFSTLHNHRGDPAYYVRFLDSLFSYMTLTPSILSRNFCQSFRIIYWDDCLNETLMLICMKISRIPIETL